MSRVSITGVASTLWLISLIGLMSASWCRGQPPAQESGWTGWRGPARDGRVPSLPATLAGEPDVVWEHPLDCSGLGGIAATDQLVLFGDRDPEDFHDRYRCLDAATGETRWEVKRLAIASLDYGNSPRATPLIVGESAIFLGAHGHLLCVQLADGEVVWERNLQHEFPLPGELPWGYCGSPLLVDDKLIVAPGAPDASLIAVDPASGATLWKSPGAMPSYGSLHVGMLGGRRQIVGHDADSIGGWDIETGRRLWRVVPENDGDFNVPTPIIHDGRLIIVTENNGARAYRFQENGQMDDLPAAHFPKLRSDMSTPVLVAGKLYCVKDFLFCLDAEDGLRELWRLRDRALGDYASVIASADRLLVVGNGELLLLRTDGSKEVVSRQRIFPGKSELYSHPALVGNRLYVRGESSLRCIRL